MRQNSPRCVRGPAAGGQGVTLVEVITVLIILGVLAAIVVPRALRPSMARPYAAGVASHLRYLQLRAMKEKVASWGMRCDGDKYWGFNGTNSNDAATWTPLPGEAAVQVPLTTKGFSLSPFVVIFDQYGIPYAEGGATKLSSPLTVSVMESGANASLTIAPETGYIP